MYCTHCGHENSRGANFCANCGRPLRAVAGGDAGGDSTTGALGAHAEPSEAPEDQEHDPEALDIADIVRDLEPGTALLISARGPNEGARFLLDRDVVSVGRHPESDIFLDDITVSRRHAEFRRDGQRFWVHDVGSLNGTYVNGSRADDQLLSTGDEVQVGKFKLVAFVAEPPQ